MLADDLTHDDVLALLERGQLAGPEDDFGVVEIPEHARRASDYLKDAA